MGHRCCSKQKVKRGLWSPEEDEKLLRYITTHAHGCWSSVPKLAGLQRCGKSCRLRWINYLRPDLKRGSFTAEEEQIIIDVHRILGNRWAQIAKHLPGRTDNEVKNMWNSCIKKKLISQGLDPKTHNLMASHHQRHSVKTSACNPSRQQPNSVFTVNPHNSQPPLQKTIATSTTTITTTTTTTFDQYHNPNTLVCNSTVKDQSISNDFINFPCGSSIESTPISSSSSCCRFGFNNIDENDCIWGTSVEVLFGGHEEPQQLQKEKMICDELQLDKIDEPKGDQDLDAPYDSCSSFDLEFVESTLMSGEICRHLTSMDDLAWHF